MDGFKIVQLTDIHVGPTIGRGFVEELVSKVAALAPDVIAITGDLVDGSVEALREHVAPLADLRAKQGVFFVTGNHEYYSGVDAWIAELRRIGVRVLRNERVELRGKDGADAIDLAGIDDASAHGNGHGPDLEKAVRGRDPNRPLVLLAHQPKQIADAERHGVALQLSGHTHGGQIWPFSLAVLLQQPFVQGLHRRGDVQIYVSPGTGYWGPPMRVGTQCEITEITLRVG
jgi:predicted MPP superfamily phosphohydrolase